MNSENINNSVADSEEISLKELILKCQDWWKYLFSKWILVSGFGIIGALIGLGYSYFKKPVYNATTTFVLEDEKSGGGLSSLAGLASIAGVDLGGSGGGIFQGDNILGLYKSRTMLEQTLLTEVEYKGKKQKLVDIYIDFNQLRKKWSDKPELIKIQFGAGIDRSKTQELRLDRLRDSVLGTIVKDLNANFLTVNKPDKKLSTIEVHIKSEEEFFAKTFNDLLVRNVNEFYINTKTKKTLQNVRILQHKTDSVRSVMNGAIYTAVAVADATPNLNPTRQIQRVAPAQRAQFSAETNKSILAEMVKNLEMTKMSLLRETPLIQVVDQPIYPLEKNRVGKVKGTLIGCFIGVFIIVFCITIRRFVKQILE